MRQGASLMAALVLTVCGAAVGTAAAQVGEFRVLPYQQRATTEGMTLTWFTIAGVAGSIEVTGPGLGSPLVLATTPELLPILDYQSADELNAGGEFPFAATAIFETPGVPARNYKHQVTLTGLQPDSVYTYTVTQGASVYSNTFRTAPTSDTERSLRLTVLSDSETLVRGRTRFREWSRTVPQLPGSTGRPAGTGRGRDSYLLSETVGYTENLKKIEARNPDLIVMPGDLIEGTGNEQQRRWDEFWRHNAGEYTDILSARPIVAAIGNNCIFNGTAPSANAQIKYARDQWSAYWDFEPSDNPAYQDLYYRSDYGPVTIITLCSVGAMGANDNVAPPQGQGISVNFPQNLDTNRAWFFQYPFGDVPDFNIGTEQYDWAVEQLAAARDAGQIIFVQWHHTPFSRGVHGSSVTSTQSGEAMRIYAPLMEQYRVAAVFTGHSEVSEMSFFDLDNDGYGVHLWDVGAAGDGLRGVEDAPGSVNPAIIAWQNNPINPEGAAFTMNPFSRWTADQSEPELWNGNQLLQGGKHYGFLEVDITPLAGGEFRIELQNYHNFPLNSGDANFTVTGFELRPYSNRVVLEGPANNLQSVDVGCSPADLSLDGVVDSGDLGLFVTAFLAQDPAADLTGDGQVDSGDVSSFIALFLTGC